MKKHIVLFAILVALTVITLACAPKEAVTVDLLEMMAHIEEEITLPEGMEDITAKDLERLYNITSSEYSQFVGKFSNIGILGDEIVIIEGSSVDNVKEIKSKMEQRYQSKLNEMDGYIPEEYDKIEKGKVVEKGNYVAILVSESQEKLEELFEAGFEN